MRDGIGIPSMLAAQAQLDARANPAPTLRGNLHEFPYPNNIKSLKRIVGKYPALDVARQEAPRIVTREPQGRLGEIIRAE